MDKRNNRFLRWGVAVLIIGLGIAAWGAVGNIKNNQNQGKTTPVEEKVEDSFPDKEKGDTNTAEEGKKLLDFCADKNLNEWFDKIEENTPVKMNYIIYGEAPISLDFTDRDLILKTVNALKTVEIGGISDKDPSMVCDGGGCAYTFFMEDETRRFFSFEIGCYRWNRGKWHDVTSYGDLVEVNNQLADIGIKENVDVYADDGGFYTSVLETYRTEWEAEDGIGGGLFIYISEQGIIPHIEVCRCETTESSPEAFLKGELDSYQRKQIEESGTTLIDVSEIENFKVGRSTYPSVLYTAEMPDEQGKGKICYLNLAFAEKDGLLNEPCMVRMCAVYRELDGVDSNSVNSEKSRVSGILKVAISGFGFKYKGYEKKDVQPNNYLVDFINDDRLRTWFAGTDDNLPDSVLCQEKSYEYINDPEEIRKLLNAIQTVKIGEISNARVGASDRRLYDFIYYESGERQPFEFFGNVFSWDGKDYEVLDWGTLNHTD